MMLVHGNSSAVPLNGGRGSSTDSDESHDPGQDVKTDGSSSNLVLAEPARINQESPNGMANLSEHNWIEVSKCLNPQQMCQTQFVCKYFHVFWEYYLNYINSIQYPKKDQPKLFAVPELFSLDFAMNFGFACFHDKKPLIITLEAGDHHLNVGVDHTNTQINRAFRGVKIVGNGSNETDTTICVPIYGPISVLSGFLKNFAMDETGEKCVNLENIEVRLVSIEGRGSSPHQPHIVKQDVRPPTLRRTSTIVQYIFPKLVWISGDGRIRKKSLNFNELHSYLKRVFLFDKSGVVRESKEYRMNLGTAGSSFF